MAPNLGEEENNRTYGNDPVEILNDWVTIAEDGYLTLRFATRWGNGQPHCQPDQYKEPGQFL